MRSQEREGAEDPRAVTVKERDQQGEETGERRVFFKTAFVFGLSQTEPLPAVEPVSLEPPREPLTGGSHAHLIEPMVAFAGSLGFAVSFEAIPGSAGGWCDPKNKRIVVDADAPANARLRTLIHECAHAMGIDYESYSRPQAEVMVETVTLLAASTVGLAVDGETIPYREIGAATGDSVRSRPTAPPRPRRRPVLSGDRLERRRGVVGELVRAPQRRADALNLKLARGEGGEQPPAVVRAKHERRAVCPGCLGIEGLHVGDHLGQHPPEPVTDRDHPGTVELRRLWVQQVVDAPFWLTAL